MSVQEFFQALENGQRHFIQLEFEYEKGFNGKNLCGVVFESCFLYLDFRNSNLTNSKFINCNIKEADFRGANLTNGLIRNCSVESTMFKGAKVENFRFEENYCFGVTTGPGDFDKVFKNTDES